MDYTFIAHDMGASVIHGFGRRRRPDTTSNEPDQILRPESGQRVKSLPVLRSRKMAEQKRFHP